MPHGDDPARILRIVPLYEYRCTTCDVVFEARRAMDEADAPAACPDGHVGARRLLSVFAAAGRAGEPGPSRPCGAACACAS